jgi:hypothetical protein
MSPLYDSFTKAEATALFPVRTEVIGLRSWLASVGVPGILPQCNCQWQVLWVETLGWLRLSGLSLFDLASSFLLVCIYLLRSFIFSSLL